MTQKAVILAGKILKWLLLSLASVVLFVLLMNRLYPLSLDPALQTSRIITDAQGEWLYTTTNTDQKWRFAVDIDKLDPLYLKMLLLFEDKRFWHHYGMDPLAMGRAIWQLLSRGHITSGGSTLTMQLARLLEPKPRTIRSKLIEIIRAFQLESTYTKKQILKAYLTLAPYGGNVEGIVGASMRYFGKPPYALSPSESAILVSLPQSPERNRPDRHPTASKQSRDKVLTLAHDQHLISDTLYRRSVQEAVNSHHFPYPRLSPHLSQKLLKRLPGASILTTLDATLQKQLEQWAAAQGEILPKGSTLSVLIVKNHTAAIQAYLGSHDMFSPKVAGFVDMIPVSRSPGSALKPFLYALGFERHLVHPNTIISDKETRFGDYLPHNYSRKYTGEISASYALRHSLNIPAVKILQRLGAETFVRELTLLTGKLIIPNKQATLPVALGGLGISIWQVAQLYTALANGGSAPKLHILQEEENLTQLPTLLSSQSAKMTTAILRTLPPPQGYRNSYQKIAYKTGTSYGYRDLWTAAYTPEYTTIVWVGRPDNAPQRKLSAREVAAPMAFEVMQMLEALHPMKNWQWRSDYLGGSAPKALKYFDKEKQVRHTALQFLYPEKNSRFRSAGCHDVTVEVAAEYGELPYFWYLDDHPAKLDAQRVNLRFGRGAHTITIIDASGDAVSRDIWVDMPDCQEKSSTI